MDVWCRAKNREDKAPGAVRLSHDGNCSWGYLPHHSSAGKARWGWVLNMATASAPKNGARLSAGRLVLHLHFIMHNVANDPNL
jgi:hypothetical protein